MLPQYAPLIEPADSERVRQQVETTFVGCGKTVTEFEQAVAAHSGVKHCIATTSGTAALMLALLALGRPGLTAQGSLPGLHFPGRGERRTVARLRGRTRRYRGGYFINVANAPERKRSNVRGQSPRLFLLTITPTSALDVMKCDQCATGSACRLSRIAPSVSAC